MENALSIELFLLGCAVPVALEAYKADKPATWVLWGAAVTFGILGFSYQWLVTVAPVITNIIARIVGSPASWFSLTVALFFVARSFWTRRSETLMASSGLYAAVEEKLAAQSQALQAVNDGYQRMLAMEARFVGDNDRLRFDLKEELNKLGQLLDAHGNKLNALDGLGALPEKLEAVRVDGAIAKGALEKLAEQHKQDKERTLSALHAIGARERLSNLEASIQQDASDLYARLHAGEIYDSQKWLQWENVHSHFMESLESWLVDAAWYAIAVKERTLAVNEALYGADWSVKDNQFPNAEAVRRFKKFRLIYDNWESVLPTVKNGLDQVAFAGMSEKDVRFGRPAG